MEQTSLRSILRSIGKHFKYALQAETARIARLEALEILANIRELRASFPGELVFAGSAIAALDNIEIEMITVLQGQIKVEDILAPFKSATIWFESLVGALERTGQTSAVNTTLGEGWRTQTALRFRETILALQG
jgi:hypothetical protein